MPPVPPSRELFGSPITMRMFSLALRPQLMLTLQNWVAPLPDSALVMLLMLGSNTIPASCVHWRVAAAKALLDKPVRTSVESATPHASSSFLMTFLPCKLLHVP